MAAMSRYCHDAVVIVLVSAIVGCHGHRPDRTHPADPFAATGVAPLPVGSMAGTSVLLLEVGAVVIGDSTGVPSDLEARRSALVEVAYSALDTALRRDAREVTWVGLDEQRRAVRRNPTLGLEPERFPTHYMVGGDVDRVPDPLWGQLRTLGAITG